MTAWSYSSLNTFKQCPKKYYHLKVAKDVKDKGSTATVYGQEVHTAAEEFIRDGKEVPKKFSFMDPILDSLNKIEGDKHCELKLGVAKTDDGYRPTGFFDADVWWRGIADVVIINGNTAYSIDYKTSKNARYADTKQLDLVAGGLFVEFPEVDTIKSALLFVVSGDLIRKNHYREHMSKYINTFESTLDRLDTAEQTAVWNAVSGPLCRFCPVVSCEHNTR